jgi:hypothetical protein
MVGLVERMLKLHKDLAQSQESGEEGRDSEGNQRD